MKTYKYINKNGVTIPTLWVGFTGRKCSGKSEAANIIDSELRIAGLSPIHTSPSDMLKLAVAAAFDIPLWEVEEAKTTDMGRFILQSVGTEWRRRFGDTYWTRRMLTQIHKDIDTLTASQPIVVLIPSIRFNNEVDMLRERNGSLIRVHRPGVSDNTTDTHISETESDNLVQDLVLNNSGDLDNLTEQCKILVNNQILPAIYG
jgi:hypothetical protein